MPRVTLPSKHADGSPNWVDLKSADDFMAGELFAMHAAVKVRPGPKGEYSPAEVADDRVNAFLGSAITAWSFPTPIPSQNGVAAPDVVIGRAMKARDWGKLRKEASPLMDALEGEDLPDPKSGTGADSESAPVPEQQAG
jgi:hypothetical protein